MRRAGRGGGGGGGVGGTVRDSKGVVGVVGMLWLLRVRFAPSWQGSSFKLLCWAADTERLFGETGSRLGKLSQATGCLVLKLQERHSTKVS